MTAAERPWSAVVRLDEVGETGRHIELDASEAVLISAVNPASLGSLLEKAGAMLARNLNADSNLSLPERRPGLSQFA